MAETERPGGIDIRDLADRQCARAHHAGAARDERNGDRGDHVDQVGPEDRDHGERQDDQRERHEDVHQALEQQIEGAGEIGAADAEHQADRGADDGRGQAHEQRRAGAVDDPGQDVPAHLVGAEPVFRARRPQHDLEGIGFRIVDRDVFGEHGGEDHHQDDHRTERAERLFAAQLAGLLPYGPAFP